VEALAGGGGQERQVGDYEGPLFVGDVAGVRLSVRRVLMLPLYSR
jgi:hypothetical protein